jgi:hypothetical protein
LQAFARTSGIIEVTNQLIMKEQERERGPYWQHDVALGEGTFYQDQLYTIRMKLHTSLEPFRGQEELVRLDHPVTNRTYLHAKPYILEPQIMLTVDLYDKPTGEGAISKIDATEWTGMRHHDIGNAQAWYYQQDQLLVLWECYLFDFARTEDPASDKNLTTIWSGFEHHLRERFPHTQRIVTPSWENIYERSAWQAFLQQQGYRTFNNQAFLKEMANT